MHSVSGKHQFSICSTTLTFLVMDYSAVYGEYHEYGYGYGAYDGNDYTYEEGMTPGDAEIGDDAQDQIDLLPGKEKFEVAGEMLDAAFDQPMPGPVLGLPPPVPDRACPARPDRSPFDDIPLTEKELKKKKKKEKKEKEKKGKKEKKKKS